MKQEMQMKKSAKARIKFIEELEPTCKRAQSLMEGLMKIRSVSIPMLKEELRKIGFVLSDATVYRWINNPLRLNRYQSNAVAKVLCVSHELIDRIIRGEDVDIE